MGAFAFDADNCAHVGHIDGARMNAGERLAQVLKNFAGRRLQAHRHRGGADRFVFLAASGGIDTITDFTSASDAIVISASGFGGGLIAGAGASLVTTADFVSASGAGAYFIYDTDGADAGLYFDTTGGSGSDAVLFARLTGVPSLAAADISII